MMKKLIILMFLISLAMIPTQTFAENDIVGIEPYTGMIGPNHFLYRFKLMMERVDESLTFDPVKKMEKQMKYAQLRLAEAQHEISMNRTQTAEKAMLNYNTQMQKVNTVLNNEKLYTALIETKMQTEQKNIIEQIQAKLETKNQFYNYN